MMRLGDVLVINGQAVVVARIERREGFPVRIEVDPAPECQLAIFRDTRPPAGLSAARAPHVSKGEQALRASTIVLAALLGVAVFPPAAQAADCAIDQVGKRYNAQVEITLGNLASPTRQWIYSGNGAPMLRYSAPSKIEVLPPVVETSAALAVGFAACSNVLEVLDALAEAQMNFNQCVGISKGGTFEDARRAFCDADAG